MGPYVGYVQVSLGLAKKHRTPKCLTDLSFLSLRFLQSRSSPHLPCLRRLSLPVFRRRLRIWPTSDRGCQSSFPQTTPLQRTLRTGRTWRSGRMTSCSGRRQRSVRSPACRVPLVDRADRSIYPFDGCRGSKKARRWTGTWAWTTRGAMTWSSSTTGRHRSCSTPRNRKSPLPHAACPLPAHERDLRLSTSSFRV